MRSKNSKIVPGLYRLEIEIENKERREDSKVLTLYHNFKTRKELNSYISGVLDLIDVQGNKWKRYGWTLDNYN